MHRPPSPRRCLLPSLALLLPACSGGCHGEGGVPPPEVAGVVQVGRVVHPQLTECSGLAASRRHPGVFWTHTDGASKVRTALHAIDRQGNSLGAFPVAGPRLHDWEDLAIDARDQLYIADLGNNERKRVEVAVHVVAEPDPGAGGGEVLVTRSYRLRYPDKPFDAESLVVLGGHGYVVSKVFDDQRAGLYRFALAADGPQVLQLVARLQITSPVTGATLSADGRLLGLVGHRGAFVYRVDGDLSELGGRKPHQVRFADRHIEGCCFVPEGLLACAESRELWLFTDERFRPDR